MINELEYTGNILSGERLTASFSKILGCGVMRVKSDNTVPNITSVNSCGCACDIAENLIVKQELKCYEMHCHAGEQSEKFGGKYIYFCPSGMVFIICPVEPRDYLVCGPVSPVESEDFDIDELIEKLSVDLPSEQIERALKTVPVITPEKIKCAADLLYVCAKHLSVSMPDKYDRNSEIYEQQRQIGEYIQNMKASLIRESGYITYPYDKEKLLIYSIVNNDLENSRKYLNEILGHIFFSSATNLDVIKVRAMELSVMISRAALDGGADQYRISGINERFISEFFNYQTIEEVCWSLTDILKKFTRETFEFSKVKHVDIISKALAYIKSNYMRKLTLSEVAEYVFLSPSYFSKIFKQEMNYYFKDYVNYVRVEKSKMLLLTDKMSLVDIADNAGFYDQSYFSKVFKKTTGVTPKKFRETGGKAPLKDVPFRNR